MSRTGTAAPTQTVPGGEQAVFRRIAHDIRDKAGIRREDVWFTPVSNERADWSSGNGIMQYAPASGLQRRTSDMPGGARAIDLDELARLAAAGGGARRLIGIAGAPGSGKSTVADALADRLNAEAPGRAGVLPMDGYHFDDGVLAARGLLARKGAPETFDVGGLRHMLGRLRANGEDEIAVPVFDRALEISRAGARLIARRTEVLVVEGNYLLLALAPWAGLHVAFDMTVMIRVGEDVLRQRLEARWQGYGLSPAQMRAKLDDNDLPNGRHLIANSVTADWVLDN